MMKTNSSPEHPTTLYEWWQTEDSWRSKELHPWPVPAVAAVHKLDATERATIRFRVPTFADIPLDQGYVTEAIMRLHVFTQRGNLPWMSAHRVAQHFQTVYGDHHPRSARYAKQGWECLAVVAMSGFIEITIDATPTPGDPQHARRMSFAQRLRELEVDTSQIRPAS